MIIDALIDKIKKTANPTVVGLDPRLETIPGFIREAAFEQYGRTTKGAAEAILAFNRGIIDEIFDLVPAVKPQIAMYEQFGADGIDAYVKTIQYAREKDLIVIGDVKRSDIASTAEAYSDGHIGRVAVDGCEWEVYREDWITLNPYLGSDSIEPYLENCQKYDKGLFILVKTSNPNSGEIQDLLCGDGEVRETLYEKVGGLVSRWGSPFIGSHGFSSIGAVVGATHREQAETLRKRMPHTFFLVPGYGAQGAKAEDLAVCFNRDGLGALVNSSRGITAAYISEWGKKQFDETEFAKASRQAVVDMKNDLQRCMAI